MIELKKINTKHKPIISMSWRLDQFFTKNSLLKKMDINQEHMNINEEHNFFTIPVRKYMQHQE